jgi:pimeloyl-ACP methyl ester carboxylesterase
MKKLIPFLIGRYLNIMSILFPAHAASLGFRIFCYPFRSQIKSYQYDFFNSSEQTVIEHHGVKVKVYRWNSGPKKILFLHGWQSHSFRWKNYLDSFPAEQYSLYALDAPGHGLTTGSFLTVPLYSEVIEKFLHNYGGVDAIISHSLGSFTSLYTLHRLPLLPVKKLVLLAPPGEALEFLEFYQKSLRLSSRTARKISEYFEEVITEPVDFFSASRFAENLSRPGLIIHDEDDNETSVQHSRNIHSKWRKSQLLITKGLSHNLKSPEVVAKVAQFVNEDVTHHQLADRH